MSQIENNSPLRQREPRIRNRAYLAWVSKLPCVNCLSRCGALRFGVHCAHIKIGYPEAGWRAFGHSEKSHDERAVGLCPSCHMRQHSNAGGDERWFWESMGIYPPALCQALVEAFARGESGRKVVEKFAAEARRTCVRP